VLLWKISAILKRNAGNEESENDLSEYPIGKFLYNHRLRTLRFAGTVQVLSPKEAALLKMMCTSKEGILSRKDALTKIWNADNYFTTRSMDVFIARLRKYLKADPSIEIINIHGNGFRLLVH
jgi:DNA-binding response OmpR family regulator